MAKQRGMIQLEGTLGDLNFYVRQGKPVVRKAGGGFNGKAILNRPEMVRVRENAGEFGRVSRAKKIFRLGLWPFLKDVSDVTLHGRLMKLFQDIKCFDTVAPRGQRRFADGLATESGKRMLQSFSLTRQRASALLPAKGVYAEGRYALPDFDMRDLRLPSGTDGMQVGFGILEADFESGDFTFHVSDAVFLDRNADGRGCTLVPDTSAVNGIAVLQVRMYQEVHGTKYFLSEGMALEIVG